MLLRCYRLAVLVLIVWVIREHYLWLRVDAGAQINVEEVAAFLPEAAELDLDESPRMGLHVLDSSGKHIGYVVRTMPMIKLIGYSGYTDTMVVLDAQLKVVGAKVRRSDDNPTNV